MRHRALLVCVTVALWSLAWAGSGTTQVAGVRHPDQVSVGGQELVLNGAGLRRILLLRVYVAALYLPEPLHDSRAILDHDLPRRLQITLLRDLSTDQHLDALKKGLVANNSPSDLAAIDVETEQFLDYIRGLHGVPAGTVILLDYVPGTGTRVSVHDRHLGTVAGEAFNRAVLKIWLGEHPVQASLKRALLGEG